jgi:protein-disulfide isomerase
MSASRGHGGLLCPNVSLAIGVRKTWRSWHNRAVSPHSRFELTVPIDEADHVLGEPHAPVSVVEFGDFECPNCKQAAPAVQVLLDRFPGRIRFAYRHFPAEAAHPHALPAAEVSEVAGAQGRFWAMHNMLFDNQLHLKAPQLRGYAERLELDMARYAAELDDHIYLQRIREHAQAARNSGARGTPTFFVNGIIQDVSFGVHQLFKAVEKALRR